MNLLRLTFLASDKTATSGDSEIMCAKARYIIDLNNEAVQNN